MLLTQQLLFEHYAVGEIKVVRDTHDFSGIESIPDAVERLLSGQSIGKVLLDL